MAITTMGQDDLHFEKEVNRFWAALYDELPKRVFLTEGKHRYWKVADDFGDGGFFPSFQRMPDCVDKKNVGAEDWTLKILFLNMYYRRRARKKMFYMDPISSFLCAQYEDKNRALVGYLEDKLLRKVQGYGPLTVFSLHDGLASVFPKLTAFDLVFFTEDILTDDYRSALFYRKPRVFLGRAFDALGEILGINRFFMD